MDKYIAGQVNTVPVNLTKLERLAERLKRLIDQDTDDNAQEMKGLFWRLSGDERMVLISLLKDKAPDSRKMYCSLLSEYVNDL